VFTRRELIFSIAALLLFFQIYLQPSISIMKYFDEFVAVICLLKIIFNVIYRKLERNHIKMIIWMLLAMFICLLGNFYANIQTGLAPILNDIGNTFKVFVVYIGATLFLKPVKNKHRIIRVLASAMRVFVLVVFVCLILHTFGVVAMGTEVRYGLVAFKFINGGADQFSMVFYSIMFIFTLDLMINPTKRKSRWIYIWMALIVWASTLRAKAIAYAIVYLFLYRAVVIKGERFKLNWKNALVILAALLFFGVDQLETYFMSEQTARSVLLTYGIYTMLRYFPLGSGFATFGTDAAVKYYSVLYDEYGFDSVWGLSRNYAAFSHDTYWPAIIAQFGLIGAAIMVIVVILWCKDLIRKAKGNKYTYFCALFIVVTMVSASAVTATFFHYVTVGIFFILPLMFIEDQSKNTIEG